jgi:hypothetical protein
VRDRRLPHRQEEASVLNALASTLAARPTRKRGPRRLALASAGKQQGGWRALAKPPPVLAVLTFLRAHDTAARRDADA